MGSQYGQDGTTPAQGGGTRDEYYVGDAIFDAGLNMTPDEAAAEFERHFEDADVAHVMAMVRWMAQGTGYLPHGVTVFRDRPEFVDCHVCLAPRLVTSTGVTAAAFDATTLYRLACGHSTI